MIKFHLLSEMVIPYTPGMVFSFILMNKIDMLLEEGV